MAKARYPVLVVLAATVVLLFLELRTPEPAGARPAAFRQPVPPDVPPDLLDALSRVGIGAHALAASGLDDVDAAGLLVRMAAAETTLVALAAQVDLADDAVELASGLALQVRERPADGELVAAYEAARASVAEANQQISQLCETLFATAVDGLQASQVQRLSACRANRGHAVPPELMVVARSDQQWRSLAKALRAEARAGRLGEDLDPEQAQLLADTRADPAVVAASASMQVNLAAIEAVLDATFQD